MRYRIRIRGVSPIITHNGAAGLDSRSAANVEKAQIAKKRGSNRTEADEVRLRELECLTSLYLDEGGAPTLPEAAFRANIEAAARTLRQGPQVREGLVVEEVEVFDYDRALGSSAEELARSVQFTVGVRVGQSRVLRTRARFDEWAATIRVDVDPELVVQEQLLTWLDIGWAPSWFGGLVSAEVGSVRTFRSGAHRNPLIDLPNSLRCGRARRGRAQRGIAGRGWAGPGKVGEQTGGGAAQSRKG